MVRNWGLEVLTYQIKQIHISKDIQIGHMQCIHVYIMTLTSSVPLKVLMLSFSHLTKVKVIIYIFFHYYPYVSYMSCYVQIQILSFGRQFGN